ncbi:MAG: L,D-transpeptidase [Polyangiaceae bacterium]|nr:L,D-transpeptidase [Polyangiaceae bacterium]
MPGWAEKGERWLDVNVTKQTLVAYEGTRPVFATLVSTGEAGLGDPETTRSTKRGIFRVYAKYRTTTMDSDETGEEFELRDVPYVQYFHQGYALHAAYWHDRFGTPRSHGCINLTPADAKWLFGFTSPAVPAGWHEAREGRSGTVVFVHP